MYRKRVSFMDHILSHLEGTQELGLLLVPVRAASLSLQTG